MDTPIFLNSSGGIISPHSRSSDYIQPFTIAPYVEQVPIPQLAVDSAAVYGDHPENLVTLTVSSGGALTFFVDSVAGGNDASGNGSYDNQIGRAHV